MIGTLNTMKIFLYLLIFQIGNSFADPLIKLPTGWIRGREDKTFENTTFYAFEKIPYAAPPLKALRFMEPQPPENWTGILNTTRLDKICYQLTRKGPQSEDCLYLNVFTPKLPNENVEPSLPVMFYMHGGGYYDGTAMNLGADRFIDNGVIYVTVNYRLGPFGFLSTGDSLIYGNNGLKDTLFALRWVHDNIRLFGGDPNQVTISGHSSGGAFVSYFLLNEKTEGLFKGAICQSGTALGPWAFQRNPRKILFQYARYLNKTFPKDFNDTIELVDYLRTAPAEELKQAAYKYYSDYVFKNVPENPEDASSLQGYFFAPVLEADNPNSFLTEKMYGSLKEGRVVSVPLMIGFTSEEGLEYCKVFSNLPEVLELYDKNLERLIPGSIRTEDKANRTRIGLAIREIYTGNEPLAKHVTDAVRLFSDNLLTRSTIKYAELYSKLAKTYFYVFSYDGQLGNIKTQCDGDGKVGHGEENKYLMCSGSQCDLSRYPETDILTQKRLITLWSNFAKYGNPTPTPLPLLQNVSWPELITENGEFLYLDIDNDLTIKSHPKETYDRWNQLYTNLKCHDFDTY